MTIDDIRYRRLGYVALNVTDLARSRQFYEEVVGLTLVTAGEQAAYLRCSDRHHDIMLVQSSTPGLKRLGWQMESEAALTSVVSHLHAIGIAVEPVPDDECADMQIGHAFRATEPTTGTTFEFFVDMAPADGPFVTSHTKIARLGHVVIASADRDATGRFMQEQLNFRISDQIEDTVIFMRCFPNPLHHSFGVGTGARPILNHVNFMVSEIDDIGKAQWRVKKAGSQIVFGPGRHPPSDSIFLYFLDPDGITLEYSFGMEEFPEHAPRAARQMPKGLQSIDYWGATPEVGFGKVGAIEAMHTDMPA